MQISIIYPISIYILGFKMATKNFISYGNLMFKYSLREIQALKKSLAPRVRHVLSRCVKFLEYSFEFMFHPLNSNWMQISTQHA